MKKDPKKTVQAPRVLQQRDLLRIKGGDGGGGPGTDIGQIQSMMGG